MLKYHRVYQTTVSGTTSAMTMLSGFPVNTGSTSVTAGNMTYAQPQQFQNSIYKIMLQN